MNAMPGDGHTIVGVNLPHIVLQPLEGDVGYKTDDVTPVYFFHYTPDALIVAADSPFKSVADLVKAAKEKPDTVTHRRLGHQLGEPLSRATRFDHEMKIKTTYVPFKGTGDMISSILGGHVPAAMSYSTLAIPQKGKMRMLAVATEKRLPQFPDVPTFKELGSTGSTARIAASACRSRRRRNVRKQVSDMMDAINKDPALRKQMFEGGFEVTDIGLDKMPTS